MCKDHTLGASLPRSCPLCHPALPTSHVLVIFILTLVSMAWTRHVVNLRCPVPKWRIEERDDWRALVDSMQADRNTLQEENARLHVRTSPSRPPGG